MCSAWQTEACITMLSVKSSGQSFAMKASTLKFNCHSTTLLAVPVLSIKGNKFIGNGTIWIGKGEALTDVKQAEIAANIFDCVQLHFGDISGQNVVLRNNDMHLGADSVIFLAGRPQQCDAASSG